jgi:hypothetical protein
MAAVNHEFHISLLPLIFWLAAGWLALGRSNRIIAKLFKEMAVLNLTKINMVTLKQ